MAHREKVVELFAGPGGWSEGAKAAQLDLDVDGIELNADACATARAAGHRRTMRDVRRVQVSEYEHVTGLIASPPCPTFSASGLRTGLGRDYQAVLDTWTSIGWGMTPAQAMTCVEDVQDPRTALLALTGVWALTLPNLEWLAFEQVPAVMDAWYDLIPELMSAGWDVTELHLADAADFGAPARRDRAFLTARVLHGSGASPIAPGRRGKGFFGSDRKGPKGEVPWRSMAEALGWDEGHTIATRGSRVPGGGNTFSADGPSWCLTSSSRSWQRDDGLQLSAQEAGYLNGFPPDYPWHGSRSSRFRQAGDVVNPIMAGLMLGEAIGVDVDDSVSAYAAELYGPRFSPLGGPQSALEPPGVQFPTAAPALSGDEVFALW